MSFMKRLAAPFWPVSNILWAVTVPVPAEIAKAKAELDAKDKNNTVGGAAIVYKGKAAFDTAMDHVGVQLSTLPKLLVAYLVMTYTLTFTGDLAQYRTLKASWILDIVVRDLFITYVSAGFWDFMMYSTYSPIYNLMRPYKFNTEYATRKQVLHDMLWTTCSTVISSAFEVFALWSWANGKTFPALNPIASAGGPWWLDQATLIWLFTMPYWRLGCFYWQHRGMHPWRWQIFGVDFGQVLFDVAHSLHHESYNPTSFSGVSMHPIESSIYYSTMFLPIAFGAHPIVMLYTKMDLTLAALIGHDGFAAIPGGGSQPHWVHHHMREVNFGEAYVPFDWLFGSAAATPEDAKKLIDARIQKEMDAKHAAAKKGK